MCLTKKEKKKRERERQTNFPAPDFSIGWANTGGLSVLILHFWQSEQPFSPSHGSAFFSIIIIIKKKKTQLDRMSAICAWNSGWNFRSIDACFLILKNARHLLFSYPGLQLHELHFRYTFHLPLFRDRAYLLIFRVISMLTTFFHLNYLHSSCPEEYLSTVRGAL